MLKHPFSEEPLTAITIDLRTADVLFLQSSLSSRGDKLCFVLHLTNLIDELRKHLDSNPGDLADAGRIARELVNRAKQRLSVAGASTEEPTRLHDARRGDKPRDGATHSTHKPTVAKSEPSERQRKAVSKASEEAKQKSTKRRGRSSGGA